MKRHKGGRRSLFIFKVLIVVLFSLCFFLGLAGIYDYFKFSRLFEAKLRSQPPEKTALYSRPFRLYVGQKLSPEMLQERLERIGYRELGSAIFTTEARVDWYEFDKKQSTKKVRFSQTERLGATEPAPSRYEVAFTGNRVDAITLDGQEVQSALLRPEFISNLFGTSRQKKRFIRFEELPPNLVHAVLAAEDDRFFSHPGLDIFSILRAGLINIQNRDRLQGGSTLTQQFIKNYFLTPEKSFKRKLEELYMALLLEKRLSKKQIFELYANEVYLGQVGSFGIVGFAEGARTYFGKNINDLTLSEAAFLAGMIQAPNRYSPYNHREASIQRRNHVLELMEQKEFITTHENALARRSPLAFRPRSQHNAEAPYFVDYVKQNLEREWPEWNQNVKNLNVYTTLEPDLQIAAFEAVQKGMAEVDKRLGRRKKRVEPQVALVALDPRTGHILALMGGRNYSTSQYNRAIHAFRQPGSTFKPFVYAAALEKSLDQNVSNPYTLSTSFVDEPYTFYYEDKEYSPSNYGQHYYGRVSLRRALALSLNVATVKLAEQIGFDSVVNVSSRAGFTQELKPYPSIALGTFEVTLLELAQGYAAFANGGQVTPASPILAFEKGGYLNEVSPAKPRRVLHPEVAFLITSALQSVINEGTGGGVRARGFVMPAAGKTGSSDDSWFVGYTPDLLCAVWVGLDELKSLRLSGSEAALPIWTYFMLKAQRLGSLSGESFTIPSNIVAVQIDPRTGLLAWDHCNQARTEYYIRGTEPALYCTDEYETQMVSGETSAEGQDIIPEEIDTAGTEQSVDAEKKKGGFWKRVWRTINQ